ncbi:hypothetical protein SNEBB_010419 [Seison nebaliae]|nr:hypothetical protein SNEBB_010419 [Seison nebaliae]
MSSFSRGLLIVFLLFILHRQCEEINGRKKKELEIQSDTIRDNDYQNHLVEGKSISAFLQLTERKWPTCRTMDIGLPTHGFGQESGVTVTVDSSVSKKVELEDAENGQSINNLDMEQLQKEGLSLMQIAKLKMEKTNNPENGPAVEELTVRKESETIPSISEELEEEIERDGVDIDEELEEKEQNEKRLEKRLNSETEKETEHGEEGSGYLESRREIISLLNGSSDGKGNLDGEISVSSHHYFQDVMIEQIGEEGLPSIQKNIPIETPHLENILNNVEPNVSVEDNAPKDIDRIDLEKSLENGNHFDSEGNQMKENHVGSNFHNKKEQEKEIETMESSEHLIEEGRIVEGKEKEETFANEEIHEENSNVEDVQIKDDDVRIGAVESGKENVDGLIEEELDHTDEVMTENNVEPQEIENAIYTPGINKEYPSVDNNQEDFIKDENISINNYQEDFIKDENISINNNQEDSIDKEESSKTEERFSKELIEDDSSSNQLTRKKNTFEEKKVIITNLSENDSEKNNVTTSVPHVHISLRRNVSAIEQQMGISLERPKEKKKSLLKSDEQSGYRESVTRTSWMIGLIRSYFSCKWSESSTSNLAVTSQRIEEDLEETLISILEVKNSQKFLSFFLKNSRKHISFQMALYFHLNCRYVDRFLLINFVELKRPLSNSTLKAILHNRGIPSKFEKFFWLHYRDMIQSDHSRYEVYNNGNYLPMFFIFISKLTELFQLFNSYNLITSLVTFIIIFFMMEMHLYLSCFLWKFGKKKLLDCNRGPLNVRDEPQISERSAKNMPKVTAGPLAIRFRVNRQSAMKRKRFRSLCHGKTPEECRTNKNERCHSLVLSHSETCNVHRKDSVFLPKTKKFNIPTLHEVEENDINLDEEYRVDNRKLTEKKREKKDDIGSDRSRRSHPLTAIEKENVLPTSKRNLNILEMKKDDGIVRKGRKSKSSSVSIVHAADKKKHLPSYNRYSIVTHTTQEQDEISSTCSSFSDDSDSSQKDSHSAPKPNSVNYYKKYDVIKVKSDHNIFVNSKLPNVGCIKSDLHLFSLPKNCQPDMVEQSLMDNADSDGITNENNKMRKHLLSQQSDHKNERKMSKLLSDGIQEEASRLSSGRSLTMESSESSDSFIHVKKKIEDVGVQCDRNLFNFSSKEKLSAEDALKTIYRYAMEHDQERFQDIAHKDDMYVALSTIDHYLFLVTGFDVRLLHKYSVMLEKDIIKLRNQNVSLKCQGEMQNTKMEKLTKSNEEKSRRIIELENQFTLLNKKETINQILVNISEKIDKHCGELRLVDARRMLDQTIKDACHELDLKYDPEYRKTKSQLIRYKLSNEELEDDINVKTKILDRVQNQKLQFQRTYLHLLKEYTRMKRQLLAAQQSALNSQYREHIIGQLLLQTNNVEEVDHIRNHLLKDQRRWLQKCENEKRFVNRRSMSLSSLSQISAVDCRWKLKDNDEKITEIVRENMKNEMLNGPRSKDEILLIRPQLKDVQDIKQECLQMRKMIMIERDRHAKELEQGTKDHSVLQHKFTLLENNYATLKRSMNKLGNVTKNLHLQKSNDDLDTSSIVSEPRSMILPTKLGKSLKNAKTFSSTINLNSNETNDSASVRSGVIIYDKNRSNQNRFLNKSRQQKDRMKIGRSQNHGNDYHNRSNVSTNDQLKPFDYKDYLPDSVSPFDTILKKLSSGQSIRLERKILVSMHRHRPLLQFEGETRQSRYELSRHFYKYLPALTKYNTSVDALERKPAPNLCFNTAHLYNSLNDRYEITKCFRDFNEDYLSRRKNFKMQIKISPQQKKVLEKRCYSSQPFLLASDMPPKENLKQLPNPVRRRVETYRRMLVRNRSYHLSEKRFKRSHSAINLLHEEIHSDKSLRDSNSPSNSLVFYSLYYPSNHLDGSQ